MKQHYAEQAVRKAQLCAELKWQELVPEAWAYLDEVKIAILLLIAGLYGFALIWTLKERRKDADSTGSTGAESIQA